MRCEGNEEWVIQDLSSSAIYVNDVPLNPGVSQRIHDGDIIQFTMSNVFKYKFTLTPREEQKVKRLKLDEQIFDSVLIEQKTFAESQECQKRVLKDKLQTKQKEQDELKQQLEFLLKQQSATIEDTEDLRKQITMLEGRIESGNVQEQYLRSNYTELLEKLENERVQFEIRLDAEKRKWQDALNVSNQEKEALEVKMGEQMEKWRVEQQAEWKSVMENRVKEEKNIQARLMNEKTVLEEKLKETEKALKEQEAKVETIQNNGMEFYFYDYQIIGIKYKTLIILLFTVAGPSDNSANNCIFLEFVNDPSTFPILETIDLTIDTQFGAEPEKKETVLNKVSDIMDEQLTCSICSELFVKATTLNCMHTFCHYCIVSWNKKRKECPVCRARVAAMNRSIVLDNFIESMLENLPTTTKDRRNELIEERNGKRV